jgi:hypothetical protein
MEPLIDYSMSHVVISNGYLKGTLNNGPSKTWADFGTFVLVGKFY